MALTNKLTAIANAIRAKTGGTSELTLDDMVTEISNISVGTGSGSTLDKTVNFMFNDELFASSTIIEGCGVGKITNADINNWQDADGNTIEFPFTPTETETTLYGISKTFADMIFDAYSDVVNRSVYPYIMIVGTSLKFCKTVNGFKFGACMNFDVDALTDSDFEAGASRITEVVISNKPSTHTTDSSGGTIANISSWWYSANYNMGATKFVSLV